MFCLTGSITQHHDEEEHILNNLADTGKSAVVASLRRSGVVRATRVIWLGEQVCQNAHKIATADKGTRHAANPGGCRSDYSRMLSPTIIIEEVSCSWLFKLFLPLIYMYLVVVVAVMVVAVVAIVFHKLVITPCGCN